MTSWKKKFSIIWTGQAFSLLTSAIIQFAIIWWITEQTGSARVLALASCAAILPQACLGLFIGVWIDRGDRKRIMILSDCFVACCSIILAVIYYLGTIEIWQIYLLLALRSIGSSFQFPAMQASVPLLAPENELPRIAGISQLLQSGSNIAGPALGALLITLLPMSAIMILDMAGALIAVTTLLFVSIPRPSSSSETTRTVFEEMINAFQAIYRNKGLFLLMIAWIFCIFMYMPVNALFPLMTYQHFNGEAIEMGIVESAFGVGSFIGSLAIGIWSIKKHKVLVINFAYILMGISLSVSGLLTPSDFFFFVILVALLGISCPLFNSAIMATIQTKIAPNMLGRIFSLFGTLCVLPIPIGLVVTGILAEKIGVANSFVISGILITTTGIVCCFIPAILKLDK